MSMTGDDKVLSYRLQVHRITDRIGFEWQIPGDALEVTGLWGSVRAGRLNMSAASPLTSQAGLLTLRWNAPGDVFYQGPVLLEARHEDNYRMMGLLPPDGFLTGTSGFSIESGRIEPVEIAVPGHLRTIQGYYLDLLNRMGGNDESYTVDLFLTYRRKAQ